MLAKPGKPFDSDEFLFEVKWDGTRGLAFDDVERRPRQPPLGGQQRDHRLVGLAVLGRRRDLGLERTARRRERGAAGARLHAQIDGHAQCATPQESGIAQ